MTKTYTYTNPVTNQTLEFQAKPTNLGLRRNSLSLINSFLEFAEPSTGRSAAKLNSIERKEKPNPDDYKGKGKADKYKEALEEYASTESLYLSTLADYNRKLALAMTSFLLDEDNLREVFKQFLDGDIEAIDYTAESDESCAALMELGVQVMTDFFDKGRSLMSVFKK